MAKQDANTRALKALVIAMGVLIVVGLTVVVITIAMRLTGPEGADGQTAPRTPRPARTPRPVKPPRPPGPLRPAADRQPAAGAEGARAFGDLQLGMADSCRIVEATASSGTLVVRLDGPAQDGCGQLVVVDPAQGRVLGRIRPGMAPGSRPDGGEAAR